MNDFWMQLALALLPAMVTGAITGVAAAAVLKLELQYIRRDLDRLEARLDRLSTRRSTDAAPSQKADL